MAAAVNDHAILDACLRRSPEIADGIAPLRTYEGFTTAGLAYNRAIAESDRPILILAHQDVYFPAGTLDRVVARLDEVERRDPDWGVIGLIGLTSEGRVVGETWSTGLGRLVGTRDGLPARVETLDELVLIVRRDGRLRFDESLPSFHLFGTDIVRTALAQGAGAWAIDLPVVHNSLPVLSLGGGYAKAYRYMQRKHVANLPLANLVCPIRRSGLTRLLRDFRIRRRHRGRMDRGTLTQDAPAIARRLGYEGTT